MVTHEAGSSKPLVALEGDLAGILSLSNTNKNAASITEDLNPVPVDIKPRILTTAIDLDDGTASVDLAISVAAYFELTTDEARSIVAEVESAVAKWRGVAARLGLGAGEIDRMASCFEH